MRQERVVGLQLGSDGRPALGYQYRFDVEEMRAPLRAVVTDAGWRWKPLVWDAPAWLRWATE